MNRDDLIATRCELAQAIARAEPRAEDQLRIQELEKALVKIKEDAAPVDSWLDYKPARNDES